MKVICKDRRQKSRGSGPEGRAVGSVLADVDRLLGPKTYGELETLEKQIVEKLNSNEPIDVDYWEQLLRSLTVWKAKARLKKVYQSVIDSRLHVLRKQQHEEADAIKTKLQVMLAGPQLVLESGQDRPLPTPVEADGQGSSVSSSRDLDPEPLLRMRSEDRGLEVIDEESFLRNAVSLYQSQSQCSRIYV